jgi:hypothetical protein
MHVDSHDLFNMKLRTCLDTGVLIELNNFATLFLKLMIDENSY